MKKILFAFLSIVTILSVLFVFAACSSEETGTATGDGTTPPTATGEGTDAPQTVPDETVDLFPDGEEPTPEPPVLEEPSTPTTDKSIAAKSWCDKAYKEALNGKTVSPLSTVSWSDTYRTYSNEMDRYYRYYLQGGMTMSQFTSLMNSFASVKEAKGLALGYLDAAEARTVSEPLKEAKAWIEKENYLMAVRCLAKAPSSEKAEVKALIVKDLELFKSAVTEEITDFMVRYRINDGKVFLNALNGCGIDAHLASELQRLEEYRAFQEDDLVSVSTLNTLENIYTHCLIAYPDINFASERTYRWCGDDCLTPYEFMTIIQALYDKGYIIVDANLFYNAETDSPVTSLKLPKGKKPLLLTYDDVTYDSRKDNRGMVDKLIVDENGRICTYNEFADGSSEISYGNEIFPLIEAFCRKHPDFTFRGAKGTLFFTGFDGICGYRSQSEPLDEAEAALGLDRQDEVRKAKFVIENLRDEGFSFGSHSYNHHRMPKYTDSELRWDTTHWLEEVGAIVGETPLFCWPYGGHTLGNVSLRSNDGHKYLFNSGFKFFFGCGAGRYLANEPDDHGIFSDRKAITGEILYFYKMGYKTYLREYSYLFDPNSVWDPARVPYMYLPPYDKANDKTLNPDA